MIFDGGKGNNNKKKKEKKIESEINNIGSGVSSGMMNIWLADRERMRSSIYLSR